ncbi:MAG: alpha/beta hydrolase fold domain-containing protein [Gloeobacteraceae cyanobacterium ES-bin-144]|nr:alpha/beta hydrolase fold domain-containing protein [Verrucomicrobiales bacterium]
MKSTKHFIHVAILTSVSFLQADPFNDRDLNKDGKLTPEELPEKIRNNFKRVDKDHDGFISREEDAAARQGMNSNPQKLPDTVKATLDIPYADTANPAQRLDLYLPVKRASDKPLPVIVFIHGGAWKAGKKADGRASLLPFLTSGEYAAASVEYRLSQEAKWPAQIEDCKAAIRWLKAHAGEHGLDAEKIAVWGTSAGGHLVAMLGVSGGVKELEGTLGKHLDQSSRVTCVADYFGPANLLTMADFPSKIAHNDADSPESLLIGGALQENKDRARSASPVTYVTSDDAPVFIAHGTADRLVPFNQSEVFAATLTAAKVPVYPQTIESGGHGGFEGPRLNARLKVFFDHYLRGAKGLPESGTLRVRE